MSLSVFAFEPCRFIVQHSGLVDSSAAAASHGEQGTPVSSSPPSSRPSWQGRVLVHSLFESLCRGCFEKKWRRKISACRGIRKTCAVMNWQTARMFEFKLMQVQSRSCTTAGVCCAGTLVCVCVCACVRVRARRLSQRSVAVDGVETRHACLCVSVSVSVCSCFCFCFLGGFCVTPLSLSAGVCVCVFYVERSCLVLCVFVFVGDPHPTPPPPRLPTASAATMVRVEQCRESKAQVPLGAVVFTDLISFPAFTVLVRRRWVLR